MAKKKKQIHLNIIDFQKYYQKDDLIIQPTPVVENTIEEKKKKIFEKNEYVQNIEWRTTESPDKKINNKINDDNNQFKKSDSTIILGSRGKNKLTDTKEDVDFANLRNKKNEEDVDFANLRNKKNEEDLDFANLRNKKKEEDVDFANLRNKKNEDVDFANLRNKKKEEDVDFANLRNKKNEDVDFANLRNKKKEEDVDFANLRNKKKEEDIDFANLRNKKNEEDLDFANLRNKKKEEDVDFANLRNKKNEEDLDFANLRNKKNEEDVDFANLRNKKNDTETKIEKPYHLKRLEELRKQKQLKRQETDISQNVKLEENGKIYEKGEVKVDEKKEVKIDEQKEEEVKTDDTIKSTEETKPKESAKPEPIAEKSEIDGNNETKMSETPKKKYIPKRVIMYQEELKKKEEELKKKEEELKKKEEERKKQRELSKQIKSQTSDGSNVFIPSAKLLHLESLKEDKKETKIEIKKDSKSVITTPGSKKNAIILNKYKSAEKNVKNIFLEIAEKTENAKIVEKMDIEEIAKKKREELYKKQLEKITKINEENTKYNNIYKHDINIIKSFYSQIKDKILQNYLFTEDDTANICAILKTDECNYLESHVPFYVAISVFILSLPQKLEDDIYIKRASHLKNLLFYLKQNSKIENHDDYILNDIIKLCDELKYPYLSDETTLLEAIFDCLLFCGIISKDAFIKWFMDDNLDSELKSKAMLQLIYWNNWLKDEINDEEYVEDDPEEHIEEKAAEDDIEKNVPKNFIFRKIKKKFL